MDFGFSIKLSDNNTKVAKEQLEKEKLRILRLWGSKAVEKSVDAISGNAGIPSAVDTGRLRASISYILPDGQKGDSGLITSNQQAGDKLSGKSEEDSVFVGSNVDYAIYVHEGTGSGDSEIPARPFLRLGIDNMKEDAEEIAERVLKGEI